MRWPMTRAPSTATMSAAVSVRRSVRVDDAATRALMVRFYELWNPRRDAHGAAAGATGSSPAPTAITASEALRAAQEHVRAQPRWRHPYYWAAWVLWGLP